MARKRITETTLNLDTTTRAQDYGATWIERDTLDDTPPSRRREVGAMRPVWQSIRYTVKIDRSYPGQSRVRAEVWRNAWVEVVTLYGQDPQLLALVAREKTGINPTGITLQAIVTEVADKLLRPAVLGVLSD